VAEFSELTTTQVKIILRIGQSKVRGKKPKHRAGYRYYELESNNLSESEILYAHPSMKQEGLVTRLEKEKYHNDGRLEIVYLIDLTSSGWVAYFVAKDATRSGIESRDLDYLDTLLDKEIVKLSDLNAEVLLKYADYVDLSDRSGYSVSNFARQVLSTEKVDTARSLLDGLKDGIDKAPRSGLRNSDVEIIYQIVTKIEQELNEPEPKENLIKAFLLVLLEYYKHIAVFIGLIGSVITIISYLQHH
jgi:hypothetical protein